MRAGYGAVAAGQPLDLPGGLPQSRTVARFGSKLIYRLLAATQILCVLLMQMLSVVLLPSSVPPHAPLQECATEQHGCCCSPAARASHTCCCSAGKTGEAADAVETLLRSARCSGAAPDSAAPVFQFDWLLARVDDFRPVDCGRELVAGPVPESPRRPVEPLLPPPKVLVAVQVQEV